tara:strand:+ start:339 stop:776 length:438 start_codon:yes stop_codon:yes gene_type:complete
MGADVYMAKGFDKRMEEHRVLLDELGDHPSHEQLAPLYDKIYVQGDVYYRDSYNSGSVLWAMGLSWWNDILPMLDDEGTLDKDGIETFLGLVEDKPLSVSSEFLEHMPEGWGHADAMKYLQKEQDALISFLKKALNTEDTLSCSL